MVTEGFVELPITAAHLVRVATLPRVYRDPFDRMLVAQAITQGLLILTPDGLISQYPVQTAW